VAQLWSRDSLGTIEVTGMSAAIVAVDAATKAATVEVAWLHKVGGGLVTFGVIGDLASVQAAVDAAGAACAELAIPSRSSVIGRPALPHGPLASPHRQEGQ
jgi:ethanolamine utilization protein EutM